MSNLVRCKSLNCIPEKKYHEKLFSINSSDESLKIKDIKLTAINRYAESNIPIEYWDLKMEKHFKGDARLLSKYNEYTSDIKKIYVDGTSICFAGSYGVGKTMTMCCILKKCSEKGFSTLYTSISDIVSVLLNAPNDEKFSARKELSMVDFLCIDEMDNRYYTKSENANDMFAKTFESILRTRLSNKLPTLLATNSPNIKETFSNFFKDSLDSLMSKITEFPVFGNDFRKIRNV